MALILQVSSAVYTSWLSILGWVPEPRECYIGLDDELGDDLQA
jgi:hypothetical protein